MAEHEKTGETRVPQDRLVIAIVSPILREGSSHLETERQRKARDMLNITLRLANSLDCKPLLVGQTPTLLVEEGNTSNTPAKDIDVSLVADVPPKVVHEKLKEIIAEMPKNPKPSKPLDVEAGREYSSYNISRIFGIQRDDIALVNPTDEHGQPTLSSLRLVSMNTQFPWTKPAGRSENPINKDPVFDMGFPPYDEFTKQYLTAGEFDPSIEYTGAFEDGLIVLTKTKPILDATAINRMSPVSRTIMALRAFSVNSSIVREIHIDEPIRPTRYEFIYNLIPAFRKAERLRGLDILTDNEFVENILKHSFPYIYQVINSLGDDNKVRNSMFENIARRKGLRQNSLVTSILGVALRESFIENNIPNPVGMAGEISSLLFSYDQNLNSASAQKQSELQ